MSDFTFETKIDFGTFSGKKKLTYTSWNGNAPRYDIRDWYDDKAGKGITFDKTELKNLYGLLKTIYNATNDKVEDVTEDIADEPIEESNLFDDILNDDTDNDKYPDDIVKIFDALDDMFKDYNTDKTYGEMPFAKGERIQYYVRKGDKEFNIKENELKNLGVKWFITNKNNLYIYTL